MKSRKSRKGPLRRHQVKADNGWTHVVKGPNAKAVESQVASSPTLHGPELQAKLDLFTNTWRTSPAFGRTREFFEHSILPLKGLNIDRCVCFALGSFTTSLSVRLQHRDCSRSLSQLVALESWLELLRTRFAIKRIVFQDPAFVDTDRDFLCARGYEVVEEPKAQALVSDSSLVFTPCAPVEISRWVLREKRPPVWIRNPMSFNGVERVARRVDPETQDSSEESMYALRQALYDDWSLPFFPHSDWHTGMVVSWHTDSKARDKCMEGNDE